MYVPRKTATERKLYSFTQLPAGWHYGRGGPISREVLTQAELCYWQLLMHGVSRTDAFPGVDGEVLVTGYIKDVMGRQHYIGIEVGRGGQIEVTHEVNDVECCVEEGLDLTGSNRVISKISEEIWGTSGSSIQNIGNLNLSLIHISEPTRPY